MAKSLLTELGQILCWHTQNDTETDPLENNTLIHS